LCISCKFYTFSSCFSIFFFIFIIANLFLFLMKKWVGYCLPFKNNVNVLVVIGEGNKMPTLNKRNYKTVHLKKTHPTLSAGISLLGSRRAILPRHSATTLRTPSSSLSQ
jgi:hypothetical protein